MALKSKCLSEFVLARIMRGLHYWILVGKITSMENSGLSSVGQLRPVFKLHGKATVSRCLVTDATAWIGPKKQVLVTMVGWNEYTLQRWKCCRHLAILAYLLKTRYYSESRTFNLIYQPTPCANEAARRKMEWHINPEKNNYNDERKRCTYINVS